MTCAFRRGTTTGVDGLTITVRDSLDNLIDPYLLRYAVYDYTTGIEVLIGSPVNTPTRASLGRYYAAVVLPADANIGDWRIRWAIQDTAVDPVYELVEEFQVVGDSTVVSFTGDVNLDALIHSLRIILRDNNPDRNYSVDGKEKVKVKVKDKEFILTLEEFYQIIEDGKNDCL